MCIYCFNYIRIWKFCCLHLLIPKMIVYLSFPLEWYNRLQTTKTCKSLPISKTDQQRELLWWVDQKRKILFALHWLTISNFPQYDYTILYLLHFFPSSSSCLWNHLLHLNKWSYYHSSFHDNNQSNSINYYMRANFQSNLSPLML